MAGFHELPHNSAEQVEAYLRGALELVERLEPPPELRPLVFDKAVQLLSAKTLVQPPPALAGVTMAPAVRGRH